MFEHSTHLHGQFNTMGTDNVNVTWEGNSGYSYKMEYMLSYISA